jgi:hypothetical protein
MCSAFDAARVVAVRLSAPRTVLGRQTDDRADFIAGEPTTNEERFGQAFNRRFGVSNNACRSTPGQNEPRVDLGRCIIDRPRDGHAWLSSFSLPLLRPSIRRVASWPTSKSVARSNI